MRKREGLEGGKRKEVGRVRSKRGGVLVGVTTMAAWRRFFCLYWVAWKLSDSECQHVNNIG